MDGETKITHIALGDHAEQEDTAQIYSYRNGVSIQLGDGRRIYCCEHQPTEEPEAGLKLVFEKPAEPDGPDRPQAFTDYGVEDGKSVAGIALSRRAAVGLWLLVGELLEQGFIQVGDMEELKELQNEPQ